MLHIVSGGRQNKKKNHTAGGQRRMARLVQARILWATPPKKNHKLPQNRIQSSKHELGNE